jgi:hypothetical protein
MKVVIFDGKRGLFFKAPGEWVKLKNEAFVFADRSTAIKFYENHYLPDARIIQWTPGEDSDRRPSVES